MEDRANLGEPLAEYVFLVINVIDVHVGKCPVVYFPEERNTAWCKHGTYEFYKLVIVEMCSGVYGLQGLDSSLLLLVMVYRI